MGGAAIETKTNVAKSHDRNTFNNKLTTSNDIIGAIGRTPLIELPRMSPSASVRLFAKLEGANPSGSVKDRIALTMVENAESAGLLSAGKIILEPTSGNTGISLAMIAAVKGYELEVVMPESVSKERIQLLEAYGTKIHFSEGALGTNGSIPYAQKMAQENGRYVLLYQYGNQANPQAHYDGTGNEIVQQLPEVDVFVAGLGTGGTLTGAGRRIKEHNKEARIVAATPEPDDAIQGLRSLEEGFVPPVLDETVLDARILVKSKDAFSMTKELLRKEAVFAGVSSGAVLAAALKVARRFEKANIVCLLADGGWKYLSAGLWTKEYEDLKGDVAGKVWW